MATMSTEQMVELYRRGASTHEIAEKTTITSRAVWERLKNAGVEIRPRGLAVAVSTRKARLDSFGYVTWGRTRVHRIVCRAWHGPPPTPEHEVDHIDGDKTNNHPENLEWVTHAENLRRAREDGRCVVGSDALNAKLDEDAVCEMRCLRREKGLSFAALGERYGVSPSTAHQAVRGHKWRHVECPPVPCGARHVKEHV